MTSFARFNGPIFAEFLVACENCRNKAVCAQGEASGRNVPVMVGIQRAGPGGAGRHLLRNSSRSRTNLTLTVPLTPAARRQSSLSIEPPSGLRAIDAESHIMGESSDEGER
jgi:hypothetical protein